MRDRVKEDSTFSRTLQEPEHPTALMEEHSESVLSGLGKGDPHDGKKLEAGDL